MDLNSHNKHILSQIAEVLEIEVDAANKKKPTKEELLAALEGIDEADLKEALKLIEAEEEEVEEEGEVYTYIGRGEESPTKINFMEQQQFIKGRATVVSNPTLLKKIKNNPCFVKGKVDAEDLQEMEDEAVKHADNNRKADKQMDAQFKRTHGGQGKE